MISFAKKEVYLNSMETGFNSEKNSGGQNFFSGNLQNRVVQMQQIVTINRAKFEEVFNDYYDGLFRYCNMIISSKEETEDIVQNVFLDLWRERDNLAIHTSLQAYLYKAVYFRCMNAIKHEKVKRKYYNEKFNPQELLDTDPVLIEEVNQKIEEATNSLPDQCRKIFTMSRNEGLKYQEIAHALDLSPKTIENQMGKALRMMREALREYLNLIILIITSYVS